MQRNRRWKIFQLLSVICISTCLMTGCEGCNKESTIAAETSDVSVSLSASENITSMSNTERKESVSTEVESQSTVYEDDYVNNPGGNQFSGDTLGNPVTVEVLISGDLYYVDNMRIELSEIVSKVEELEGKVIITIFDDNATQRAYKNLISSIEDLEEDFQGEIVISSCEDSNRK